MPVPIGSPPSARVAALSALVAAGAVLVFGLVLDHGLQARLVADARDEQLRVLGGYAAALERQMAKHALLTTSLAGWYRVHPDPSAEVDFPAYAEPLLAVNPSVRAFNVLHGTVITDVYPRARNRPALGVDLSQHPNPGPLAALRRALDADQVTMMGPIELTQGGAGMLLFRRTGSTHADRPVLAEVVVDVPALLEEVGLHTLMRSSDVSLVAADGAVLFGAADLIDPVSHPVTVPEGTWSLAAAPVGGWQPAVHPLQLSLRGALLVLAGLVALFVFRLRQEGRRLRHAVAVRTARLEELNTRLLSNEGFRGAAMAAGSVTLWSIDTATRTLRRITSTAALGARPMVESVDNYFERVHPEDLAVVQDALEQALRTGLFSCEYRDYAGPPCPSPQWRWQHVEGRATENEAGDVVAFLGATADVTRLKNLEAELIHSGRVELMGQLAGGVIHDINNALSVVLTSLEFALLDPEATLDDHRDAAREASEATRYAALLTNQVLSFARHDEVSPTTFAWDDMCREVTGFLKRALGSGVRLELDLAAGDACVRIDRTRAMQVLANLLTNARDAMGRRGTVKVRSRVVADAPDGPAVVTEVVDTGPGVAEEVRDTLFEAFVTTKGKGTGTGLGLSTSRRIVRDGGGELSFTTSPRGTTFTVVLPQASDDLV